MIPCRAELAVLFKVLLFNSRLFGFGWVFYLMHLNTELVYFLSAGSNEQREEKQNSQHAGWIYRCCLFAAV